MFFSGFIGQSVTNSTGTYVFPSDGKIPSDWKMFQPRLGIAFITAVALLLAVGGTAAVRPWDRRVAAVAALLLAGLIAAYWATRSTGIPLLAPDAEAVDAIGVITTLVEAFGLVSAVALTQSLSRRTRRPILQEVTR